MPRTGPDRHHHRTEYSIAGEYETAEQVLRYAASLFDEAGIVFRPKWMQKIIRRELRLQGTEATVQLVERYVARKDHQLTYQGFELFVNGYADPTGARAARNLDDRGEAARIRARHLAAVAVSR